MPAIRERGVIIEAEPDDKCAEIIQELIDTRNLLFNALDHIENENKTRLADKIEADNKLKQVTEEKELLENDVKCLEDEIIRLRLNSSTSKDPSIQPDTTAGISPDESSSSSISSELAQLKAAIRQAVQDKIMIDMQNYKLVQENQRLLREVQQLQNQMKSTFSPTPPTLTISPTSPTSSSVRGTTESDQIEKMAGKLEIDSDIIKNLIKEKLALDVELSRLRNDLKAMDQNATTLLLTLGFGNESDYQINHINRVVTAIRLSERSEAAIEISRLYKEKIELQETVELYSNEIRRLVRNGSLTLLGERNLLRQEVAKKVQLQQDVEQAKQAEKLCRVQLFAGEIALDYSEKERKTLQFYVSRLVDNLKHCDFNINTTLQKEMQVAKQATDQMKDLQSQLEMASQTVINTTRQADSIETELQMHRKTNELLDNNLRKSLADIQKLNYEVDFCLVREKKHSEKWSLDTTDLQEKYNNTLNQLNQLKEEHALLDSSVVRCVQFLKEKTTAFDDCTSRLQQCEANKTELVKSCDRDNLTVAIAKLVQEKTIVENNLTRCGSTVGNLEENVNTLSKDVSKYQELLREKTRLEMELESSVNRFGDDIKRLVAEKGYLASKIEHSLPSCRAVSE